jgi:hypothetical protein
MVMWLSRGERPGARRLHFRDSGVLPKSFFIVDGATVFRTPKLVRVMRRKPNTAPGETSEIPFASRAFDVVASTSVFNDIWAASGASSCRMDNYAIDPPGGGHTEPHRVRRCVCVGVALV